MADDRKIRGENVDISRPEAAREFTEVDPETAAVGIGLPRGIVKT